MRAGKWQYQQTSKMCGCVVERSMLGWRREPPIVCDEKWGGGGRGIGLVRSLDYLTRPPFDPGEEPVVG